MPYYKRYTVNLGFSGYAMIEVEKARGESDAIAKAVKLYQGHPERYSVDELQRWPDADMAEKDE